MRLNAPRFYPVLVFAGLALLLIGVQMAVVQSAAFDRQSNWLSLGVTVDLMVGLPVLYYFLIIRRLNAPERTLLVIVGLALLTTLLILPTSQRQLVGWVRSALVGVEAGVVLYAMSRIRRIRRHYRELSQAGPDFIENLTASLHAALGPWRLNYLLASELAVLRYGLFGWLFPVERTSADTAFTTHRTSGQVALTIGVLGTGLIEIVVLHLLVSRWSPTVAFVLTGASLYGLLFLVADLIAVIKRPVLLRAGQVMLRFGLRGYGTVNRRQVAAVTAIRERPAKAADLFDGAFITAPNLLLTLREPVTMIKPLGTRKTVCRITLFVDDPTLFTHNLTAA